MALQMTRPLPSYTPTTQTPTQPKTETETETETETLRCTAPPQEHEFHPQMTFLISLNAHLFRQLISIRVALLSPSVIEIMAPLTHVPPSCRLQLLLLTLPVSQVLPFPPICSHDLLLTVSSLLLISPRALME
jgi:hypothetical protein